MTSHRNAQHNRSMLSGFYQATRQLGETHDQHLLVMREIKQRIRQRDAEPAAWFTGPTRAEWVAGRLERGEPMTATEIGRALMGGES